ncbi:MAG: GNAT family N-acetyltransferase [Chloroflexi bacterium]|nr:GNAT family N-acetyltransferase [Chloroflexota bacterium]
MPGDFPRAPAPWGPETTHADAVATTIECPRLELVLLSPEFLAALLEGRRDEAQALVPFVLPESWPEEHEAHFRMRLKQMQDDPATAGWLVRAMVLKGSRQAVGRIGFHGPPGVNCRQDPAAVEIGYDVDAGSRRRGYAAEAAGALVSWALAQPGISRVLASISPTNEPSLGLVRKLGFVEVGTGWDDEDGEQVVFERRV